MIISTIIIFLLVLGTIVFIHELGHFLMAKLYGVRVEEFGLGFPPKIFGFKKGETEYTINWVPLGGFVKIVGEDGEEKHDPRSFSSRSIFQRFQIIAAGVIMNVFLAFVIFSILFMVGFPQGISGEDISKLKNARDFGVIVGEVTKDSTAFNDDFKPGDKIVSIDGKNIQSVKDLQSAIEGKGDQKAVIVVARGKENVTKEIVPVEDLSVTITEVSKDSPAFAADLRKDDKILSIDGTNIYSIRDLQVVIDEKRGEKVAIVIARGDENMIKEVVPRKETNENEGALGVALSEGMSLAEIAVFSYTPLEAIQKGFEYTIQMMMVIITAFVFIIMQLFKTGTTTAEVSGPVGIMSMTQQAAAMGFMTVLNFIAIISVNLAIINALPLPALDGGRLLFLIIEKIKGSPLNQEWEAKANNVGFALLMLLMVVVTFKDILRLDLWGKITGLFG
ncbi:MAG: RIP metalloprotease RseP [Candidatus Paceibacterota bacterium]|jgi:regulator of sigma E protease